MIHAEILTEFGAVKLQTLQEMKIISVMAPCPPAIHETVEAAVALTLAGIVQGDCQPRFSGANVSRFCCNNASFRLIALDMMSA
jgi:hypothetical protein